MDDTITTTGTTTTVGPLPPTTSPRAPRTTSSLTAPPGVDSSTGITSPSSSSQAPVSPISGGARSNTAANAANNRRRISGSSSTGRTGGTYGTGLGHGGVRKRGTDPANSMTGMGTGARDTTGSGSGLIDEGTKLFPNASEMSGMAMGSGMGSGEGEGNVFRNERSASTSSASSTGSGDLMGSASTVTEWPHPRRGSHGLFEGLTAQKRRNDPASIARRKSLSEQRPPSGFIGKMWDNWVRGVPPDI
ncbi:putative conidiation-specific expression protein [Sordaria brevicollis]|uniref:Conidiation-specific expression protein n=1 Tax=Sordaria brevicollis TaxID=83679 RepID=A0AAE0P9M4_SORBR|nr:putative conidiation-specific expression protein [Sordaria brevicollis]